MAELSQLSSAADASTSAGADEANIVGKVSNILKSKKNNVSTAVHVSKRAARRAKRQEELQATKTERRRTERERRKQRAAQLKHVAFGLRDALLQVYDSVEARRHWDVHVHRNTPYTDVFDKHECVYLSSESENVLESIDVNKVYIIGGLVDHNAHKGLCHRLAVDNGVAHARLPIDRHLKLDTRCVLAINHVFDILLAFSASNDWRQALLTAIPGRKGVHVLDNNDDGHNKGDCTDVETTSS